LRFSLNCFFVVLRFFYINYNYTRHAVKASNKKSEKRKDSQFSLKRKIKYKKITPKKSFRRSREKSDKQFFFKIAYAENCLDRHTPLKFHAI
jgi:hypothetical protein